MEKIVVKVGLTRRITRLFQEEVNTLLAEGYKIKSLSVEKKGLKILCTAWLENSKPKK